MLFVVPNVVPMSTPTFKVILRKDKKSTRNEMPLYLRITKNRRSVQKSLDIKINPKDWDDKRSCVKKSHPTSVRLNNYLRKKITEYESAYLAQLSAKKNNSAKTIKERQIRNEGSADFFLYFERHLQRRLDHGKIGTHDKEKTILKKLRAFSKKEKLLFREIDVTFLDKFKNI